MNEIGRGSLIADVSSGSAASPVPSRSRRSGFGWRLLATAVILVLIAAGAIAWWATRGGPTLRYTTASVTRGSVVLAVTSTGTINPELTVIVGSYVSGVIQQLYCDYNTAVKAGQICARIDPRPYQTVVSQSQANLEMAKAQLEKDTANLTYAKLSYQRNFDLAKRQFGSQDAADSARNLFDQAQAQIAVDQATIDQRQAELDAAKVNLGYTNIVSPVDGTVVSRNVTQGQTVAVELPDADPVPDRYRPHEDAGRHQCQRERHRRHQGR